MNTGTIDFIGIMLGSFISGGYALLGVLYIALHDYLHKEGEKSPILNGVRALGVSVLLIIATVVFYMVTSK